MVKKRCSRLIITAITVLLPLLLLACNDKDTRGADGITLTETAFATTIDEYNRPLNNKSYFPPETPKIYCCVKISNAPADTELRADWIYVKGEDPTAENTVMESTVVSVDGTRYVAFSYAFSKPEIKWIKGEYNVVLYINDVPMIKGPFVIR